MNIHAYPIQSICKENDIQYLGLFGSYARNEARQDSDIDLLVEFRTIKSFFELARIKKTLEKTLDKKVDLVLKKSLKDSLKPFIYQDLQPLYEENR
jgi:hypothetical protein